MVDWQIISNIIMALAVIVAMGTFIWEVKSRHKEHAFSTFLRLLDFYSENMTERRKKWEIIKETVRANPKISEDIGDKTSTLDYLLRRTQQAESLYAIEHGLFEYEIRSLNLLDELCKYALKEEQMALILKISNSSEVSFYQNRLKDIISIRDKEKQNRLFSIPHYRHLQKFRVEDYFEALGETRPS